MIYLLGVMLLFSFTAAVLATILILKYVKLVNENTQISLYLKKITNTVSSVRYGNLKARIDADEGPFTNKLTNSLNSMFESISDRENMIQEYINREKALNAMKSDFIATLTHDLKVPIIAQDNTFDLFLNRVFGDLNDTQEQAMKNLKISNMDLKHLIESLLQTYKMEQPSFEISKTKNADIIKIVNDAIELINPIAQAHGKEVCFASKENCFADVDIFLLKRVVQNMLLNALAHSFSSKCVNISLCCDEAFYTIRVQDYGCGIEKSEIEKIFQKYYSSSSKFTKASTGLGLYLSNRIVKLHGGRIDVKSICANDNENEHGTTFDIVMPLQ